MGKEKTYKRIIELSTQKFFSSGFSKISMDEIVKELGMSKATIYRYYNSKSELCSAVINNFFGEIESIIFELKEQNISTYDRIYLFMEKLSIKLDAISIQAANDIETTAPYLYKEFMDKRKKVILDNLASLLDEGKKSGEFRSDISEVLVANMIFASVSRLSSKEFMINNNFSYSEILRGILNVIIEGYMSKDI